MASFDFIGAASKSYEQVWYYKGYLAKVAIPVVFIKVFCLLSVFMMNGDETINILRGNLVMFPSYILEGIYYAMVARFIVFREPVFIWGKPVSPPEPSPQEKKGITYIHGANFSRKTAIQASVAFYLLVFLFFAVLGATVMMPAADVLPVNTENEVQVIESALPKQLIMIIGLCVIAVMIWCVRYMVLSIPTAMGLKPGHFLRKLGGFDASSKLVILIFLCTFPVMAILFPLRATLLVGITSLPALFIILDVCTSVLLSLLVNTLTVFALVYATIEIMTGEEKEDH